MQVNSVEQLDADQVSAVMALVEGAAHIDGVAPLSEQVLLAARLGDTAETASPPHLLAYAGTQLAGYAHLERGMAAHSGVAATAELVVDPGLRRQGVGTTLIRALEDALPDDVDLQIWSHGDLVAARAFAGREGYSVVRELWAMRRSLRADAGSLPAVHLPEGFTARHFVVGRDEDAWLRVNARAFAEHPEQGRTTRLDLDRRIAQSWFDATGFILIEDIRAATAVLAASHWTKVVAAEEPKVSPTQGEVYVVGVDPAYQGLGLGRAATVLGLEHLEQRGLDEAVLYVDADNTAAVATYSRLGFSRFAVDVMYSHALSGTSATIGA